MIVPFVRIFNHMNRGKIINWTSPNRCSYRQFIYVAEVRRTKRIYNNLQSYIHLAGCTSKLILSRPVPSRSFPQTIISRPAMTSIVSSHPVPSRPRTGWDGIYPGSCGALIRISLLYTTFIWYVDNRTNYTINIISTFLLNLLENILKNRRIHNSVKERYESSFFF